MTSTPFRLAPKARHDDGRAPLCYPFGEVEGVGSEMASFDFAPLALRYAQDERVTDG